MKKLIYMCAAAVFLLTGCVQEKKYISPKTQDYIICSLGELPPTLDMPDTENNNYKGIYSSLFEGLVRMDRQGEIKAGLAEEWDISSDGIEYSFNIREDAKWSDGTPITADDFVVFFKYILSKSANNPSVKELYPIYGAEDYYKGKKSFGEVAISAVDKSKLQIRLNQPYPRILQVLSQPRYTLRKSSAKLKQWKERYGEILYSGPFIVEKVDKSGVVLGKNNNYWQSDYITNDKFLLNNSESKEAALAEFEAGKVDLLLNPPANEVERVISSDNTIIINSKDIYALCFDGGRKSSGDALDFRKKIIGSIDVEQLTQEGLKEFNPEEYGIFKTVTTFSTIGDDIRSNSPDEEAKEEKKTLTVIAQSGDISKKIGSELGKQIEKALGFKVKVKYIMSGEFEEEIKKGDYDMLLKKLKNNYEENYSELVKNSYKVFPLFNNSEVLVKNDYIQGIEIDYFDNIILDNVYQE